MKVLSILQPWASLIVLGHKKIETRSWNTNYRGELLIHASLSLSNNQKQLLQQEPFHSCLKHLRMLRDDLRSVWNIPRGYVIGKATLLHCVKTEDILFCKEKGIPLKNYWKEEHRRAADWDKEIAFGDYSPGRYGWLLSDPVLFNEPIPVKGRLGLWEYDGSIPV